MYATQELPSPLPDGPEVWPVLLDRLQRSERLRDLPVFDDLRAEMQARRDVGIARYGKTLHRDDGRPLGVDAFQECLDLLVYLERDRMRLLERLEAIAREHEAKEARLRAERQAARAAAPVTPLSVRCPRCCAKPGKRCHGANTYMDQPHPERVRAAKRRSR